MTESAFFGMDRAAPDADFEIVDATASAAIASALIGEHAGTAQQLQDTKEERQPAMDDLVAQVARLQSEVGHAKEELGSARAEIAQLKQQLSGRYSIYSVTEKPSKSSELTLMEQLALLELREQSDGKNSLTPRFFVSPRTSIAYRACVLIELALRGRIALEDGEQGLLERKVLVVSTEATGDRLLDQALNLIQTHEKASVTAWLQTLREEMNEVRCKVAFGMADKGVLKRWMEDSYLFGVLPYNSVRMDDDNNEKEKVIKILRDSTVSKWREDDRAFALIALAPSVIDLPEFQETLGGDDREVVRGRMNEMRNVDHEAEGAKSDVPLMWAVLKAKDSFWF